MTQNRSYRCNACSTEVIAESIEEAECPICPEKTKMKEVWEKNI